MAALKDLIAKLRLDTTDFQKGLRGVAPKLKAVGAAMTAATVGVAVAIRGQLNVADRIGETAQKLGVSTEALSALTYAAELSGVEAEALGAGLRKLTQHMADAAGGGKKAAALFDGLGVSVTNADGSLRSAETVMADVSEVLAQMPDGAEKTALAMAVFGKNAGPDLVPLLNQGRLGIERLSTEAASMGLVISGKTAEAAGNFNDNLDRIRKTVGGLVLQLAAEFAPTLEAISELMVEATKWFRDLSPEVRAVASHIALVALAAGPLILGLGLIIGPLQAVLTAMRALMVVALANPFVVIGIAAAAAAVAIYYNWSEIKAWFADIWAGIKQTGADLWTGIGDMAARAAEAVKGAWDGVIAYFEQLLASLPAVFSAAWDGVIASVGKWVEDFRQIGRDLMAGLMSGITAGTPAAETVIYDAMGNVAGVAADALEVKSPSRLFQRIGRFLMQGLGLGILDGVPQVDAAMQDVTDSIDGKGQSLVERMEDFKSAAQSAFVGFVTGAKTAQEALAGLLASMAQTLATQGFNALWGALFPGFANGAAFAGGKVTAFADGGVVAGATAFRMQGGMGVMGEAGPEAIMPLTRIGGKLGVMAEGRGAGSMTVAFDASLGDLVVAMRDEAGRVVNEARQGIVQQSVAAVDGAMRKTKSFGQR